MSAGQAFNLPLVSSSAYRGFTHFLDVSVPKGQLAFLLRRVLKGRESNNRLAIRTTIRCS